MAKRINLTEVLISAVDKLAAVLDKTAAHDTRLTALETAVPSENSSGIVRLQYRPNLPPALKNVSGGRQVQIAVPPQYVGKTALYDRELHILPETVDTWLDVGRGEPFEIIVFTADAQVLTAGIDVRALADARLQELAEQDRQWRNNQLQAFEQELRDSDLRRLDMFAYSVDGAAAELPKVRAKLQQWADFIPHLEKALPILDELYQIEGRRTDSEAYRRLEDLMRNDTPPSIGLYSLYGLDAYRFATSSSADTAKAEVQAEIDKRRQALSAVDTALNALEDLIRRRQHALDTLGDNPDTAEEKAALEAYRRSLDEA